MSFQSAVCYHVLFCDSANSMWFRMVIRWCLSAGTMDANEMVPQKAIGVLLSLQKHPSALFEGTEARIPSQQLPDVPHALDKEGDGDGSRGNPQGKAECSQ